MKQIRHITLLIGFLFFGFVYFSTESNVFKDWFGNIKPNTGCFSTDRYRYGDLFGLSFISRFKSDRQICDYVIDTCHSKKNISLCIIGDSYMGIFISQKQFCGVSNFFIQDWNTKAGYWNFDSSTTSILIIETTERYFRNRLGDAEVAKNKLLIKKINQIESGNETITDNWKDFFGNNNLHIEAMLFDYPFFTSTKELKANINYVFFKKVSNDVTVSKACDRLFLSETIIDSLNTSSYSKIDDNEIEQLVLNMNSIRDYYLQAGFSQIYFSIIPNPVSVFEPERNNFNHLIDRIQNHKEKKFAIIDCYALAKKNPQNFFLLSDTHWTTFGSDQWARSANDSIVKFANRIKN